MVEGARAAGQSPPQAAAEPQAKAKPGCCAYFLYYTLAGFAYWFGAKRFDFDDDGDFDAEDVEQFLENGISHLHGNFFHAHYNTRDPNKKSQSVAEAIKDEVKLDRDGDGQVSLEEAIESKVEGGDAVEDEIKEELIKKQRLPVYILGETVLALVLWLVFDIKKVVEGYNPLLDPIMHLGGIDSLAEGMTDLRAWGPDCTDYRGQVWRWITYQWTHAGFTHVAMNSVLNCMLGVPLEGFYGHVRMFFFYNAGVIGGALCYLIGDGHRGVVGMSGGCYSLLGMHIAGLVMNWKQFKFRRFMVLFLTILVGMDIVIYVFTHNTESSSVSAHVGGAVAGFIMGTVWGRNLRMNNIERVIIATAFFVGLAMTAFCIVWMLVKPGQSLFEEEGWCWMRLVNYEKLFGQQGWHCVSCLSEECRNLYQRVEDADVLNRTAAAFTAYCWDSELSKYNWIATESSYPSLSSKLDEILKANVPS